MSDFTIMNDGFKKACLDGHVETAKRYWERMDDVDFLEENIDNIFENICENGHLDMAQWLYKKIFSFTPEYGRFYCSIHM